MGDRMREIIGGFAGHGLINGHYVAGVFDYIPNIYERPVTTNDRNGGNFNFFTSRVVPVGLENSDRTASFCLWRRVA